MPPTKTQIFYEQVAEFVQQSSEFIISATTGTWMKRLLLSLYFIRHFINNLWHLILQRKFILNFISKYQQIFTSGVIENSWNGIY